jgi:hypothetical protein
VRLRLGVLSATLGSAIVAGLVLDVLAFLVARYGPQGDSWSLRGNGALLVPFGVAPAILAGAWSMLALHARGARRWARNGAMAGLVGLALVGGSVAVLVMFGSAGLRPSELFIYATWLWVAVAPVTCMVVPLEGRFSAHHWSMYLVSMLLFPVMLATAFLVAELALSPGS